MGQLHRIQCMRWVAHAADRGAGAPAGSTDIDVIGAVTAYHSTQDVVTTAGVLV